MKRTQKILIAIVLCCILVIIPAVSASATSSTASPRTVGPYDGTTYTLRATVSRTNTKVHAAVSATPSPSVSTSYYRARACVITSSGAIAADSGYYWNTTGATFGVEATLSSPSSGVSYGGKGQFKLPKNGSITLVESNYTNYLPDPGVASPVNDETANEILAEKNAWYGINKNGEHFGNVFAEELLAQQGLSLELILAQNSEGKIGYLKQEELGAYLETEEEIKEWESEHESLDEVNLYASDGETVLGVFELTGKVITNEAELERLFGLKETSTEEMIRRTDLYPTNEKGLTYGSEAEASAYYEELAADRMNELKAKYPDVYESLLERCQSALDAGTGLGVISLTELGVDGTELGFDSDQAEISFTFDEKTNQVTRIDFELSMKEYYEMYPELVYANCNVNGQQLNGYMYRNDFLTVWWDDGDPNMPLEYPVYHGEGKPGDVIEFPVYESNGEKVTGYFSYTIPGLKEEANAYEHTFGVLGDGTVFASADMIPYLLEVEGLKVDLVYAVGDHGVNGYVKQAELGCDVTSQDEFDQWVKAQPERITFDLYQADGVTVVDSFTVGK